MSFVILCGESEVVGLRTSAFGLKGVKLSPFLSTMFKITFLHLNSKFIPIFLMTCSLENHCSKSHPPPKKK